MTARPHPSGNPRSRYSRGLSSNRLRISPGSEIAIGGAICRDGPKAAIAEAPVAASARYFTIPAKMVATFLLPATFK